jgi:hypothetical protein
MVWATEITDAAPHPQEHLWVSPRLEDSVSAKLAGCSSWFLEEKALIFNHCYVV